MLGSSYLWSNNQRNLILFGDVFFTDRAISRIVNQDDLDWLVFARFTPSAYTKKPDDEIFAQSLKPNSLKEHLFTLNYIGELHKNEIINRSSAWEHYLTINCARGLNVGIHKQYIRVRVIDDLTDDLDYPEDYERFIKIKTIKTVYFSRYKLCC